MVSGVSSCFFLNKALKSLTNYKTSSDNVSVPLYRGEGKMRFAFCNTCSFIRLFDFYKKTGCYLKNVFSFNFHPSLFLLTHLISTSFPLLMFAASYCNLLSVEQWAPFFASLRWRAPYPQGRIILSIIFSNVQSES